MIRSLASRIFQLSCGAGAMEKALEKKACGAVGTLPPGTGPALCLVRDF